jgi:hypothetical protein
MKCAINNESNKDTYTTLKILRVIRKNLTDSTIHAIPNIFSINHLIIKIMWLGCLLVSGSLCSYFIVSSIQEYLEYHVITNIKIENENPIGFPSVTICNLNIFSSPKSTSIMSELMKNQTSNLKNSNDSFKVDLMSQRYKYQVNSFYLNRTIRKNLGNMIDDIILSCVFDWKDCILYDDFLHLFDIEYGNCFRFNCGYNYKNERVPFKTLTSSGLTNGLQLELFINSADENENLFSLYNGFNIYIANRLESLFYTEGINVSPGFTTKIVLNKYTIRRISRPTSKCIENTKSIDSYDSYLFKQIIKSRSRYRYTDCLDLCFQLNVEQVCKCFDAQYGNFSSKYQPCLNDEQIACVDAYYDLYLNNKLASKCDCPIECVTTSYYLTTSIAEFPTKSYANLLSKNPKILKLFNKKNITFEELRKRVLSVNVFYNSLTHLYINEKLKTNPYDLASIIGGTLGLFLGKLLNK